MRHYDNKNTMLRYAIISFLMVIVSCTVIGKAIYIATVERAYWKEVQSKVQFDSIPIPATRGSILSDNGQQLSCNLPEYRIYMDFKALKDSKCDTLWYDKYGNPTKQLDTVCTALSKYFNERSLSEYYTYLRSGFDQDNRAWPLSRYRVDYTTYNELKKLPLLKLRSGLGGFYSEELMIRNRPYGSLAHSLVGTTYKERVVFPDGRVKEQGTPKSGLELTFDTLLSGKQGMKHRRKVLNSWVAFSDTPPVNGRDLVTTINVGIQDLAERSLIDELSKHNSEKGVAIVMEVKTGDIKAMVSLDRDSAGHYHESEFNHAISDLPEPGSVFKTASFMVAIEDGYITDTAHTYVDTGGGIIEMHGAKMRDHNWHRGGYGVINVPRILQVSSNIGVSWLIEKYYGNQPEKFVDGIYRTGLPTDLDLPFVGYKAPKIRRPVRNDKGKLIGARYPGSDRLYNWSKTTLPWMSIGYETNVPPISVCTFYNAIANDGVMVKPRFVTKALVDGEVVQEFPVQVVKQKICSDKTLHIMQDMLMKVVRDGLGSKAGSNAFQVAGKTGTALIAGKGGYKSGLPSYWLSFAGYFPYENPEYTCVVCIQYTGSSPSGGTMSGKVFHDIAEGINAQKIKYDVKSAKDSASVFVPMVKDGNIHAADYVLHRLGQSTEGGWSGSYASGNPIWGTAKTNTSSVHLTKTPVIQKEFMPDVHGMGARDAVYMLETRGVKAIVKGRGKVVKQSKEPGKRLHKGERIVLEMA